MANETDDRNTSASGAGRDKGTPREGKTIGRGMTSPDSTQVPLRADTGEPDEEAIRGTGGDRDRKSK